MEEHGGAVYADLLREYGVDLGDIFLDPPELSPKKVISLLEWLPEGAYSVSLLRGTQDGYGWNAQTYLLAALVNSVRENTFVNMQVRTKKRIAPFEQVPVPGAGKKTKKSTNKFVQMAQQQWALATRS